LPFGINAVFLFSFSCAFLTCLFQPILLGFSAAQKRAVKAEKIAEWSESGTEQFYPLVNAS
jgi:hypothetical protein